MGGMSEHLIPTNFDIPKGYRQEFVFVCSGFKCVIACSNKGIRIIQSGVAPTQSIVLDWIQESIESVRKELGE